MTVSLNEKQINSLLTYLGKKPYVETFQLIEMIKSCVQQEAKNEQETQNSDVHQE